MRGRLVAVAALAMVLATTVTSASQYRRIRDVNVSCTNGLMCDLSLISPGNQIYSVALRRPAGPNAPVSLVVDSELRFEAGSEVTFSVDGAAVLSIPVSEFTYRAATYEYTYTGDVSPLVAAGRNGRQMVVSYRSRTGAGRVVFSLSGFLAGLTFMDEAQGRVGKADALEAKGVAPPASAPAVEDIDAITDIPEKIRGDFEDAAKDCGILEPDRIGVYGGFSASLGDSGVFYAIPCGAGGAYNQPFRLYMGRGEDYLPLMMPVMSARGPAVADLVWNVVWDDENKVLSAFFKGRGVGDCGSFMRWQHDSSVSDDLTGPGFVLLEHRVKNECDGDDGGGKENWPALWPN